MISQIINLLLSIFIILLLFCVMYYFIYNTKKLKFDNDDNNDIVYNGDVYNYHKYNNNSLPKIQKTERFGVDDGNLISLDEANKNLLSLINLQTYLSQYQSNYLPKINPMIRDVKKKIPQQELEISNLLATRFGLHYLDVINKGNATSYKEYLQYQNPNQNSFTQSYM